jgi:hypothetical protein
VSIYAAQWLPFEDSLDRDRQRSSRGLKLASV